jgi:hypothetical protein
VKSRGCEIVYLRCSGLARKKKFARGGEDAEAETQGGLSAWSNFSDASAALSEIGFPSGRRALGRSGAFG